MKDFKITSFAWRVEIAERLRSAGFEAQDDAAINTSLLALARFLEEHCLVKRKLMENGELIGGKKFEVRSSDLTEEGIAVIRAGLRKWEKNGCPGADIRPLERAYKKVISEARRT
jgi:hypothetical protein